MNKEEEQKVKEIMKERFGHDMVISLATVEEGIPQVRNVDGYYEDGKFYVVTYGLSNKMKQIEKNDIVGICGEWFNGHGKGKNIGHPRDEKNAELGDKLRKVFSNWYDNEANEADKNTCILCISLTNGVLFSHGDRYEVDFSVMEW